MKKRLTYMMILLPGLALLVASQAIARGTEPAAQTEKCLECHARQGIIKTFANHEFVEAYIDAGAFQASVHSSLFCTGCHTEFSRDHHPRRRFRSKEQYRRQASLICRQCHQDQEIRAKQIHANLFEMEREGVVPLCVDCHSAHSVRPVSGGQITANETHYCLSCHAQKMNLAFRDGEMLSLAVLPKVLATSAHSKLSCSDCHYGFSSEEHPKRNFKTRRHYTLASAESCRRCHFDKYTKTLQSVFHAKRSQGNLKTPVCTDCHGAHDISYVKRDGLFSAKRCGKCHPAIRDTYAKSVHGKALYDQHNQDVPVCIDCHKAHDVSNPLNTEFHENIPEMCGNCHANKAIMAKYGLSTDVVKTYLSDFHGVTLGLYKKERKVLAKPARPIAVCTDCHGIHDIQSTRQEDAAVVKANLLKRCRKCHQNATQDFPDAWLSHYEASLVNAPLVFMVKLFYKIFLPILVIGIVLQILLHIWRYAVNR